jgi:hypothetical protein
MAGIAGHKSHQRRPHQCNETEIPEGTEYLVPSRRCTDPEERTKRHAKDIDADKRPKGYLRLIELGLVALSASARRKAHKAITTRRCEITTIPRVHAREESAPRGCGAACQCFTSNALTCFSSA